MEDVADDGIRPTNGDPSEIAPELDIVSTYAGWVSLGAEAYGEGGFFDCADAAVSCEGGSDDLADQQVVLAAVRTSATMTLGDEASQLAVAFDRAGVQNAPIEFGPAGFGGFDLAAIYALDVPALGALRYVPSAGDLIRARPEARTRLSGDTLLLVVMIDRNADPTALFLTYDDAYRCGLDEDDLLDCEELNLRNASVDLAPANSSYPIDDSLE